MAEKRETRTTKCSGCAFGTVVKRLYVPAPDDDWKEAREAVVSYCSNPRIAGEADVVAFGVILECQGYVLPKEPTTQDEVVELILSKVREMGPADFGDQYPEFAVAGFAKLMMDLRTKSGEAFDGVVLQASWAIAQAVAMRRKEKQDG